MIRILNAIAELIEAKAELMREEAATVGLRTFTRAYIEGREDVMKDVEVVYVTGDEDEDG